MPVPTTTIRLDNGDSVTCGPNIFHVSRNGLKTRNLVGDSVAFEMFQKILDLENELTDLRPGRFRFAWNVLAKRGE